ncbi:MAG: BON domain-containing protein [Pseudobdellovibrio sp.]
MKITALLIYSIIFVGLIGHSEEQMAADNTGINKRDSSVVEFTAQDQSNDPIHIALASKIRADLVSDKNLSTNAKNIKIIVTTNLVVLKGPVNNKSEITKIVRLASETAPNYKILNELAVTKK